MTYLDANVIIRLVEGDEGARRPIEAILRAGVNASGILYTLTSRLSRIECRCKPLREKDADVLALFDTFFGGRELELVAVSRPVIEEATRRRASYRFKTPDAIHLASAIVARAEAFVTGDVELSRCKEFDVVIT